MEIKKPNTVWEYFKYLINYSFLILILIYVNTISYLVFISNNIQNNKHKKLMRKPELSRLQLLAGIKK